jgi:putative endonuclease
MYYVYLIKSKKTNKCYLGFTKNLKERLKQHNNRKSIATKFGIPYELIYYESYKSEKDARLREKKLKHNGQGIRRLKERLNNSFKLE